MATSRGKRLAQDIRQKVQELKQLCRGVDDDLASGAPKDRWSPKQILSHLCGPEGTGHLPILRAFLNKDIPTIDLETENPFYSEKRASMSFNELVEECEMNYERIAILAAGLSDEQLERKAHIPKMKDSPLGEYPTLEGMISGLGEFHVQSHTEQLRDILAILAAD